MAQLPDPTADLNWSGFAGAIHEIFQRQAEANPDRVCVVETRSSTSPERRFTYRQIYEASNTLAHYLHDAGVTNGDVVMIWAHRSVDLVVSLMGILAAGATMTVLDPAYPPARQQIYLEVSQPRALLRIGRATDENGPLAPQVQQYIDSELKLKADVPELRLHDNGFLSGGEIDGKDVFEKARQSGSGAPPPVIVGPDSNPTLSFTSGSEGRPKGVLGRHDSLARYFPWMAKRFNLTSESRFTMLSGIAHDPIQRDIFTPLFLGAQLLVPAKEDIQHEKLAEWFRDHEPTVSHLTPAMGQILVGGATAEFPSLQQVFFVGDVLTTRDCRTLRKLAVNANIVNMFGSTETQRAVSYYEVPSRAKNPDFMETLKDTVPAGTGMDGVQLLVVSREDRTKLCGVGETGEIYVRAAGLAEKYLGDHAKNQEKFVTNWFVDEKKWRELDQQLNKNEPWRKYFQGPRDRMYRTGDLGKYLESGDVECTGRADDQVKIRGFRIELNEIDSNLSQSPLIRDCKTLVRRDRNEEQTLVSYVVPETAEWRRFLAAREIEDVEDEGVEMGSVQVFLKKYRVLQQEVREHLKTRLPVYAVPTIYIVLNKLPLNPNGKVDKPNLPFPDVAERVEDASEEDLKNWESLSETARNVAQQWADVVRGLNPKTIRGEQNFFDLGGHSLLAQQLLLNIRKNLGVNVSINTLYEFPSLAGFSGAIERQLQKSNGVATKEVEEGDPAYAKSLDELTQRLSPKYQTADLEAIGASEELTVFLTGATGFLGAYLVKDILDRTSRKIKLIAHVRGVKDSSAALERLKLSLGAYGLWKDEWSSRLSCVIGDLSLPRLGLNDASWQRLAAEVDVVIHNGATVHWVKRYQDMMTSNVLSTLDAMALCNEGKPKTFTFVSSTSVLDTDHYIKLSEQQTSTGQGAVYESDDMQGSRRGLGTGYGQTKWVSEQLVREAGKRGLLGSVIRAGYILGDMITGVCNTDDFLVRILKGCVQLSSRPRIVNTVNAVPVNHVSRVVVAAALNPIPEGAHVIHVTAHPRLRMNEYLSILEYYGYKTPEISYNDWKLQLENFVSAGALEKDQEQHALMPLFHFCMNDLPANTRAPELDDRNAAAVLKADAQRWTGVDESFGYGIGRDDVGKYLGYLSKIKFIGLPTEKGRPLPEIKVQAQAVGGRGAA
ncbi:putative Alpha-aminoadipate reductase [Seiridium cardinale]|uniref:Alpha-aminoadipate reductase n=1 Tax=Seiridium cardinale TaxID=138064 RepID=A0ABR2XML3_9PEZI